MNGKQFFHMNGKLGDTNEHENNSITNYLHPQQETVASPTA
jgi:hypothetical protein